MKKYFCVLFMFVSTSAFSMQEVGMGKIIEVDEKHLQETGGHRYFLVVKKGNHMGAFPIKIKDHEEAKKYKELANRFVVFKGKTHSEVFPMGEHGKITSEVIEFSQLRSLDLASVRPVLAEAPGPFESKRNFNLEDEGPTKISIMMDSQVAHSAIFSSAALLLNSQVSSGGNYALSNQDINKALILTTGVMMVADRLSRALKIDFGHWKLNQ